MLGLRRHDQRQNVFVGRHGLAPGLEAPRSWVWNFKIYENHIEFLAIGAQTPGLAPGMAPGLASGFGAQAPGFGAKTSGLASGVGN